MGTGQIIKIVLLIAALVCFLLGAYAGGARPDGAGGWSTRVHFVALGLALVTIVWLIDAFTVA